MAKKKRQDHYCKICGMRKPNEKFSGKNHGKHICRACQSLPAEEKADRMRMHEFDRIMRKFPPSRYDWKLIEKYAKEYAGKESGQNAQAILDFQRELRITETDQEEFLWEVTLNALQDLEDYESEG